MNRLENFFRRSFNDPEKVNRQENWNAPSEDVWDNIQIGLAGEEKPQRKFIFWRIVAMATSALLLFSLFHVYQSKLEIQSLSEKLDKNEKVVQKIKADLQAINEKEESEIENPTLENQPHRKNGNIKNELKQATKISKAKISKEEIKSNENFNKAKPLFSNLIAATSFNNKLEEPTISINSPAITLVNKKGSPNDVTVPKKVGNTFPHLSQLANPISSLIPTNQTVERLKAPLIKLPKKRPSFYISADVSPVWTTTKNKGGQVRANESFAKREVHKTSYNAGLQAGVSWDNGWSLETGLRYNATKASIYHSRRISYQSLTENLSNSGFYESNINMDLNSSSGSFDTEVSLARSASVAIEKGVNFNLEMEFYGTKTNLDLPIIIRKGWDKGPLRWSIRAGLLNRFLLSKDYELQSFNSNDVRINPTSITFREQNNSKVAANFSTHYLIGLGLEYQFQPSVSMYLEPTFTRGMQAIVRQNGRRIFNQSKLINVGFRYRL